jgi:ADP-heptose:LPS heptosyltransferase
MLTAAVRDLHRAFPGQFVTDVRTSASQIWEGNPFLTKLDESDPQVRIIDMQYPLIHQSNRRPYHFIHGFVQFLEQELGLAIPLTDFCGDIHIADIEKRWVSQVAETGYHGPFWIIVAGGKFDFTAKWWDPAGFQVVVDHFRGRLQFVQCGEASHWHPLLNGVINLVGKTDIRQFIRLMYHAQGVVCPVTFAMHLAAAVEPAPMRPRKRPCVVIAGGREPPHWEAYPSHQFISTVGMLSCCAEGGCWKSRCQLVGDGDPKDQANFCVDGVQVSETVRIPRCMHMISPSDVIRRIEMYLAGGMLN